MHTEFLDLSHNGHFDTIGKAQQLYLFLQYLVNSMHLFTFENVCTDFTIQMNGHLIMWSQGNSHTNVQILFVGYSFSFCVSIVSSVVFLKT